MKNKYSFLSRLFFAGMDLFTLNSVHLILILLMNRVSGSEYQYLIFFLVSNMAWLFSGYINEVYSNDAHLNFERFTKRSLKAFILFIGIILLFIFLSKYEYSRLFVGLNFLGFGLIILLTRAMFLLMVLYLRKGNKFGKRVIILGYNELSKKLVNYFVESNQNVSVEGYFEDAAEVKELSYFPILGSRNDCLSYAIDHKVTEIYSTLSSDMNGYVYKMAQAAETNMIRFKLVPDLQFFENRSVHLDFIEDLPILSLRSEPLEDVVSRIKKRLFDITVSFLVITLILSWLIPIIALLIKLSSRGPVFFMQLRSGKGNHNFKCYKFRTLRVNNEAGLKQVTVGDSRITRIGSFLRKTSLDELPQFFNVFIGNMSVVGPRPHPVGFFEYQLSKYAEDYSNELKEYIIRHYIKPGVTGWAQVRGYRGEIRREEHLIKRIEHDIWYLENWSLWLDLKIVFLTVIVTVKGDKNAY